MISWNPVPGAQYYTVGWINWTEGKPLLDAGQDWFSLFHYATVLGTETSYTVKGLEGGEDYHANVRATDVAGAVGRLGGGWSPLSAWSIPAVQPAGQHGEGFCPITGLPLPEGGYLSVGDTISVGAGLLTFRLDSATTPSSVPTAGGEDYTAPTGRKLLHLCGTRTNNLGSDWYFETGTHNNLSTDRGIGFARLVGWDNPLHSGFSVSGCDTWTIPQDATTAVYAINLPGESTLYQIDLTSILTCCTNTYPDAYANPDAYAQTDGDPATYCDATAGISDYDGLRGLALKPT